MDTRHMRYFVALAETLHFGKAAARVNISQPPFSRQISAIERTLGVKLVERDSRNVALTSAGEHFLRDCRDVLARFETACRDAQLIAKGMKGELRLGFMMHAAHSVVPRLVRLFAEARPDVRLILEERIPTDIDEMLVEGKLDAAVTFGGDHAPSLRRDLLARDQLSLIARANHPILTLDAIGPEAMQHERLIAAPASVSPILRSAITAYCTDAGVIPHFALEPRLQHTIMRLVAEGLGIGLIPQSLCTELGDQLVSRSLENAPEFDVVLYSPVATKNPAVRALCHVARSFTTNEVPISRIRAEEQSASAKS